MVCRVAWVVLAWAYPAAAAGPARGPTDGSTIAPGPAGRPAFAPSEKGAKGEYTFDTGALSGVLRRGGRSSGINALTESSTKAQVAGGFGIFSLYRILSAEARYGSAAWDWPSTSQALGDGAVSVDWPAQADRPFTLRGVYRWSDANTMDLEVEVRADTALPTFEVFLASYFSGFPASFAYVGKPPGSASPGFMEAVKTGGAWQAFPRDDAAATLIQDGRWKRPPHPVTWTIMPHYAAPVAIRRDQRTGLAAVIMAPPEDCFAVLMPFGEEGHRSVYLSLLGRDLKKDETARARARLVVGKNLTDQDAIELFSKYRKGQGKAP
jgi:hypothetical protein